ncbi:rRNA maturation RNAse YbeY, partial [Neisseria meningitidis]|uniref:rRNA maturation RNAse YbeY n=1 Tax=Neisseria meningitidis TaxID=487 RepID=UPI0021F155BB
MKRTKKYPFLTLQRQRFHLNFENASSTANLPSEHDFYRWAWSDLKCGYRRADISLILLGEEAARAYNRDYRGKDYATNVLSFALNEGETLPCQVSE